MSVALGASRASWSASRASGHAADMALFATSSALFVSIDALQPAVLTGEPLLSRLVANVLVVKPRTH
jgi:hypothetical protein